MDDFNTYALIDQGLLQVYFIFILCKNQNMEQKTSDIGGIFVFMLF